MAQDLTIGRIVAYSQETEVAKVSTTYMEDSNVKIENAEIESPTRVSARASQTRIIVRHSGTLET